MCAISRAHSAGISRPVPPFIRTGKHHLPFEVFERLARDCISLQVDTINLSGIGDPILHPRFYDMLRLLEPSIAATIFTNGTFPIERCRDILRADRIIINLGEADRKSYRELHGRDFFMKVIRNIRELARLKPQFNPNFSIEVVIIVTNLNARHVERTEKLVRKLGADLVQKKEFQPSEHNREIMMPDQEEKIELEGEWPPCYHGWFYSAVKLNGDVNVCCFMDRLTVGNVCTASFKDIWGSEAYSRARASALKGTTLLGVTMNASIAVWPGATKRSPSKWDRIKRLVKKSTV